MTPGTWRSRGTSEGRRPGTKAESLIGLAVKELDFPPGCLVTLIRRYGEMIVPQGRTVLREDDRLTIIGAPVELRQLAERFAEHPTL